MAVELSILEKIDILEKRLHQFAFDRFQHEMNVEVGKAVGDEEIVERSQKQIELINTATVIHEQHLNSLKEKVDADAAE